MCSRAGRTKKMIDTGLRLLSAETAEVAERTFSVEGPLKSITFELFGRECIISESVVTQWVVMIVLAVVFFILGRNLKVVPTSRRQAAAEWIVTFFRDYVEDGMGSHYTRGYAPYIGSLFCFIILSCLMGIFGLRNPTGDVSVTITWALITFTLTIYNKFRTGGVKGFLKSYVDPVPFMLPFNIIGEFGNPISQGLRLFGNNVAGTVIMGLVYFALGGFAAGLFSIGIPAILSLYFDLFSALIQSYIFIALTAAYVSSAETG